MAKLCMGCMNPLPDDTTACTVCGFVKETVLPTVESGQNGCGATLDGGALAVIITFALSAGGVMLKKRRNVKYR